MNNLNSNLNTNLFKKLKRFLLSKSKYNFLNFICFVISISLTFNFLTWIFKSNWKVVTSNLNLYAFGSFPIDEQWRPVFWLFSLFSITLITLYGPKWNWLRKNLIFGWIGTVPLGIYLLNGGFG